MNEDIKEILENYVNHNEIELILNELREIVDEEIVDYGAELSLSECKSLLNYITNLQEENQKLKETNEEHRKINGELREENRSLRNNYNDNEQAIHKIMMENQKLVKELDTLRGRVITFINVFQDEKTFGLSYSDLKHLRGIVNNNKFDIKVLDDKLTKLKGGGKR